MSELQSSLLLKKQLAGMFHMSESEYLYIYIQFINLYICVRTHKNMFMLFNVP